MPNATVHFTSVGAATSKAGGCNVAAVKIIEFVKIEWFTCLNSATTL